MMYDSTPHTPDQTHYKDGIHPCKREDAVVPNTSSLIIEQHTLYFMCRGSAVEHAYIINGDNL